MNIEFPILGLLNEKPMHGYDLKQRLDTLMGFAWQPSYGSLYPMLKKLEGGGFISKTVAKGEGGPQRQVYRLSEAGKARFRGLLVGEGSRETVHLKVLFFDQLLAKERKDILDRDRQRRLQTVERLEAERTQREESLKPYQRILLDHGIDVLRHEIGWLNGLIEREEKSDG